MYTRVAELVLKYHTGEISEEEIAEFNNIRDKSGLDPKMLDDLLDLEKLLADLRRTK